MSLFIDEKVFLRLESWWQSVVDQAVEDAGSATRRKKFLQLKVRHTKEVIGLCEEIARLKGWSDEQVMMARIAGLLHDVGRFPQMARYGTFHDEKSVDHGLLGLRLIDEAGVLADIPALVRDALRFAVRWHNHLEYPSGNSEEEHSISLLKVVKDADRIDIMRVLKIEMIDKMLDDEDELSVSVGLLEKVERGEEVERTMIRTKVDHWLFVLNWVRQLYFSESVVILSRKGYFQSLLELIPEDDDRVCSVKKRLLASFERRLEEAG